MSPTVKNIIVFIGALVAGGVVVFGLESLSHQIFPLPADINPTDIESLKSIMQNVPAGSLALVILAHAVGAMVSGWVIGHFAASSHRLLALAMGFLWTISGVANLMMIPHPVWFSIADACVYLPMTLLGLKLATKTA
ncbi:MAG: hypothetical protein IPO37_02450 [Saprospiraceae bacterium]|jgi:hypothetical protein|nr:hypothetical protein [Saprospiraceae bacterium]MBP6446172.1 hypothetical protein [Saprospiraceae bacterium]